MPHNRTTVKLGCKPKVHDARTFKLSAYLNRLTLPTAPPVVDWTKAVPQYGMLLNDQLGDCVIAGMMHLAMGWQANAGSPDSIPSDAEVIAAYSAIGGYDPNAPLNSDGTNPTDNGCAMLDALKYWRTTGIRIAGAPNKILGFAEVNLASPAEVEAALWLFGGLFTGWDMPVSCQGQSIWQVPPEGPKGDGAPGGWGGHCAPLASEGAGIAAFQAITWGETMPVTGNFRIDYCSEAYAVISSEWLEKSGEAPSGFDLQQLQADLGAL
jgi:hypothetical protein